MIGLDTGFFFRLLEGDARAAQVWESVVAGDTVAAVSCVSLYEIERTALRGALDRAAADALLAGLPDLCRIVWLDSSDGLRRAARLAHGNGLAMADAIILTSLLDAGAEAVYTTDSDFTRYEGPASVVHL